MPCTTILVGKTASADGSTMIARNDDAGGNHFTPKKFVVVRPEHQPRVYESVISHVRITLPEDPLRYTAAPNAVEGEGIWAAHGINAANVGMTACETISSNERVLAADPLVFYRPAKCACDNSDNPLLPRPPVAGSMRVTNVPVDSSPSDEGKEEQIGGIGEEDFVVLVLPYIHSAREGVQRLGALLEQYGTYEMNGIAFNDVNEVWYMETIGGHHWMARRVPDNAVAIIPNQLGIDSLDLDDALGEQREYMCSADLREFIEKNHLDLEMGRILPTGQELYQTAKSAAAALDDGLDRFLRKSGKGQTQGGADETGQVRLHAVINPRLAFGSHDDADHVYNTPRSWDMGRYLCPKSIRWDGPNADYTPRSDDIPWCLVPERRITVEDVKYMLSLHYQGTPFDPYGSHGDAAQRGAYRSIGINRTDVLAILQVRPYVPQENRAVEWISFASNVFNVSVPFYANVENLPAYLGNTTDAVSTDNFYWSARLIAALADACVQKNLNHIEHYQLTVQSKARECIGRCDRQQASESSEEARAALREEANAEIAGLLQSETAGTLARVLHEASGHMKNQYTRSDH